MLDALPTDGLVIVAKRDCPTCVLVEPVMQSLDRAGPLAVVSQDHPTFPQGVSRVIDDQTRTLLSPNIEAGPTLIRFEAATRANHLRLGPQRRRLAGDAAEGEGLPAWQPGCGSRASSPASTRR